MTAQDFVKTASGKQPFGHSFYNLPSNEMLMKKIPFGLPNKEKNLSFAE
jgi:hypothetical protein